MTVLDQIKEIAYPVALFVFFVVQKYDAIKAKRAAERVQEQLKAQDETAAREAAAQKDRTEAAVLDLKRTTEATAVELKRTTEATAVELKRTTEATAVELKRKLDEQNQAAETAALEVKKNLEEADYKTGAKLELIHIDSNSKMAAAKKKIWDMALMLATHTGKPEDAASAREAERDYHDHMLAQEQADERLRLFTQANSSSPT
jgi:hypothetical protein